ncbi:MAG: polysaccharide biosynthesis tyrosine autokinase [Nitrospirae bacterium]|nr:polysaccharide biosynthesis tyrosine autokinase [Nitrospirota bacterium]
MEYANIAKLDIDTQRVNKIGNILMNSGKINQEDMGRILELQEVQGILFGDAAVSLGILSQEDVAWALASQFSYPYIKEGENTFSREVITIYHPYSPQVETFRSIRSGLLLQGAGQQLKTIAVVSPDPGDGRTLIASNLATVFAQLGSKTLLLDLNFRGPRVHELFNVKNNCGMSSLIIKRATIKQAVYPTPVSDLFILPSGPMPPNPVELLGWPETRELMASLKQSYDIIIIDTPSYNNGSDALLIGGLSDCAILLALKGKTTRESFGVVKKHLDSSGVKVIGSVMNETYMRRKKK